MKIVQIVPRLPPAICGVGDYARLLAGAMRPHGIETRFVVADAAWRGEADVEGFGVEHLAHPSRDGLLQALENVGADAVLLHFVGYGYDRTGCPWWLIEGLKTWRVGRSERRLLTMFHELYAIGPPWRRAFWTWRTQLSILARLLEVCDGCRTNMESRARRIEQASPLYKGRVAVAPVFSTVGERAEAAPLRQRQPQMVVFGSAAGRLNIYNGHRDALIACCQQLGVEKIVDIGKPLGEPLDLPLPIVHCGALPAQEVSDLLHNSTAGSVAYAPRQLGKSTIFAAYCAHGLLPVCYGSQNGQQDGLMPGIHFWNPNRTRAALSAQEAQAVAQAAHAWYCGHSLHAQAQATADQLRHMTTGHSCRRV